MPILRSLLVTAFLLATCVSFVGKSRAMIIGPPEVIGEGMAVMDIGLGNWAIALTPDAATPSYVAYDLTPTGDVPTLAFLAIPLSNQSGSLLTGARIRLGTLTDADTQGTSFQTSNDLTISLFLGVHSGAFQDVGGLAQVVQQANQIDITTAGLMHDESFVVVQHVMFSDPHAIAARGRLALEVTATLDATAGILPEPGMAAMLGGAALLLAGGRSTRIQKPVRHP